MPVLVDLLQERSPVSFLVKILPAKLVDIHLQPFRNGVHVAFGEEHGLWSPKSPEGSVAVGIGLAYPAADVNIWYLVAVVQVSEASVHYRRAHIQRITSIVVAVGLEGNQRAVIHHPHFPPAFDRMPLTGGHHIFIAVQHGPHRPTLLHGGNSQQSSQLDAPGLLSSKPTAHPLHPHIDAVAWYSGDPTYHFLCFHSGKSTSTEPLLQIGTDDTHVCWVEDHTSIELSSKCGITMAAFVSR